MRATTLLWAALLCATPVLAQEDAVAEPEPTLSERIDEFRELIQGREPDDAAAIERVSGFVSDYPDLEDRDKADLLRALGDALVSSRVRRPPEEQGLYVAVATALGEMEGEGGLVLVKAYRSSKFKDREWVGLRATMLESIGRTADPRHVDFLLDRAIRDPEDKILQAAGAALGDYEGAPQKVRKEIGKELIKKFNEIYNQAYDNVDPNDPLVKRFKEKLVAISDDWNQTLRRLTKQTYTNPQEWQRFYNKNKNNDWDDPAAIEH